MRYIPRKIEKTLLDYTKAFPVVGITGPRQSGKSTLLKHLFPEFRYVSFDDYRIRNFCASDPEAFIEQYDDQVIFDEAQKEPELFNLLKIVVDNKRDKKGRFLITGSSQFLFLKKISESLAGRIGLLSLLPFQLSEVPKKYQKETIYQGSYPELINDSFAHTQKWYASYIDTYLNKDLREISNIGDLRDFQRFLQLLAANTAQILNMSKFAKDIGVSVPTIKHWISVLEASYIIFLLSPYYNNYGKRITKSPKVYFYDTGLVSFLTGIETYEQFAKGPMAGSLFENFIIADIAKQIAHTKSNEKLYYYRVDGVTEIDLIVEQKQTRDIIEIKHAASFKTAMLDDVKKILKKGDSGYLLYNGKEFPYQDRLKVINYKDYLIK